MECLRQKLTVKAVRETLKSLPRNLEQTYDDIWERIEDQSEDKRILARFVLVWVTNAKRPLTVQELREVLAIEPGTVQLDPENLVDIEIVLSVCAGLVIVEEHTSLVRLVHYTTQNYLDSIQASRFPDAQTQITRTLLTVLAF
ncbi:hypothetical protein FB451DRAFT_1015181, partial [Mycena latifolia]